jgi:hypothetical protein
MPSRSIYSCQDVDNGVVTVDSTELRFEEVLCAWGWWDCPRSGVALLHGIPHRFHCEFSYALDDYPDEFSVWPIEPSQLDQELALWGQWVDWRGRFDAGEAVAPFEQQAGHAEFAAALRALSTPPADAGRAVPQWRLDRNRSFAGRVPRHFVRWQFIE